MCTYENAVYVRLHIHINYNFEMSQKIISICIFTYKATYMYMELFLRIILYTCILRELTL